MNSEKVKEIKKALEENANNSEHTHLAYIEDYRVKLVAYRDILTLVNELESENERLSDDLKFQQMTDKAYKYNMACENGKQFKQISELKEENTKLKDRIAELEKENGETMKAWFEDRECVFWDGVGEGKLKGYVQLKQFAERLKNKFDHSVSGIIYRTDTIDKKIAETLKEFL